MHCWVHDFVRIISIVYFERLAVADNSLTLQSFHLSLLMMILFKSISEAGCDAS